MTIAMVNSGNHAALEQLERRMAVGDVFAAGQILNDLYEVWDDLTITERQRLDNIEPIYQKLTLALITQQTIRFVSMNLGGHFQDAIGRA